MRTPFRAFRRFSRRAAALVMAIVYPSTFILAISEYFTKKNVDVRVLFVHIVHIDVQRGSVISY